MDLINSAPQPSGLRPGAGDLHPQHRAMANAIRMLAVDAVEAANSGHPGAPMGMAEIAQVLWTRHLQHHPDNPEWFDRDRFVLSNGHGSMLLYALLHLSGYALPIGEIRRFRQLHSLTPGHPETGITPGVETTTGPLGQGLSNAVGMALAEKLLAAEFNPPDAPELHIVDHLTWVFVGDGCLMEGISHEVCSLAGTLRLSKLIAIYDDNGISIDGHVHAWFADDTPQRFTAYGWNVIRDVDGHDVHAVDAAICSALAQARRDDGRPTLICCKTVIGKGSPNKAGTHDVHGAALGAGEVAATRAALGWPYPPFEIPEDLRAAWDCRARGKVMEEAWMRRMQAYRNRFPERAAEFDRRMRGALPSGAKGGFAAVLSHFVAWANPVASRKASQMALDALAPLLPELLGGSADLTASNLTNFKGCQRIARDQAGNHLSYGVREFGMAGIMNGVALHRGYIPYGGTFLTFSDYSRSAIRMAALMKLRVVHVMTHDSIGLGEDGPTHQSVEHIPALRMIPGLEVWRPADALETAVAWTCAIERSDGPSVLALSRQNLAPLPHHHEHPRAIARGGYVLAERNTPQALLIATGSETALALQAQAALDSRGVAVRVVSMPCTQRFDAQTAEYRASVLPGDLPAVAVEAAYPDFWYKYVGRDGCIVGMPGYGESAPGPVLFAHFGFTVEAVVEAVLRCCAAPTGD
jgi:transketolase